MSSAKKMLLSAAGVGGAGLDLAEVFSTFLYTGDTSAADDSVTFSTGIDLANEGGMLWIGCRSDARGQTIVDTEQNTNISPHSTRVGATSHSITTTSTGFTLGNGDASYNNGGTPDTYVAWSFRKAESFFDVVTYTGNGNSTRTLSHNIGGNVGMVLIKGVNEDEGWVCYHRSLATGHVLQLNTTSAQSNLGNSVDHISGSTVTLTKAGNPSFSANDNGINYVAYIFANNNNDGEFGSDGDQDIISCGSYTGTGNVPTITLGWEPQWLLIKSSSASGSWFLYDSMRGIPTGGDDSRIYPNLSNAEESSAEDVTLIPTGFKSVSSLDENGKTYIYMAIRAPMITPPAAATDVFLATAAASFSPFVVGFATDLYMAAIRGGNNINFLTADRMRGKTKYSSTNSSAAEGTDSGGVAEFDLQNSFDQGLSSSSQIRYNFKRAKGYMDVVTYTGTGSARTVDHSLGVAPEMMWIKCRDAVHSWAAYHVALGNTGIIYLDSNEAAFSLAGSTVLNNTTPTSSVFTVGTNDVLNQSTKKYIAFLFASVAGISKVGSVAHSGSSTDVDCGFSNGARFVLLKRTDAAGDCYVWDSIRGIVSGNDPYLLLNTTAAEVTNTDFIDPLSSGFTITGDFTDGTYFFYAIA